MFKYVVQVAWCQNILWDVYISQGIEENHSLSIVIKVLEVIDDLR